ncbi:MAG TPA: extracellular solute-binding protein [Vicinamibacterales bacterium]|nr:extracellular solute-binding protein [Vicinamibacterales bacterium]
MRTLANAASFVLALSVALAAQAPSRLADAKREGTLTLYTSLAPTESTPLAAAFEKKYGVKVQLWRGLSEEVVQRTITEARGRRYAVDVIETNGPEMEMIGRERLLASAWSPDRLNLFVVGYNTAKVKRAEIPATYEGFADPKWKGRIALEATDSEWMATLIKTTPGGKGMDLMRRLAALQPSLRKGHVLLASLVAAGDVPVGLAMYNSNIETLKRKGAPIDYVPVQPVVARPQGVGIAKNAPHPNAAQLFSEYVMSPEGQKLFESMGRVPASPGVNSALNNFPFVLIDPVTVLDESAKWEKVWTELFVRR